MKLSTNENVTFFSSVISSAPDGTFFFINKPVGFSIIGIEPSTFVPVDVLSSSISITVSVTRTVKNTIKTTRAAPIIKP